ncbi:putative baseplate assembly protein [Roseomonas sp. GCM10028921]
MIPSLDPNLRDLNDCGCGAGTRMAVPVAVGNRPGLSAIAYRVGTHSRFRQTALARLADAVRPNLGRLATRDDDDFTIALLDAWSVVGDVLTFYQERIANESYLRTATERRSLLELARLIGYELRPGVSAGTWLAFTVEAAPGAFGGALAAGAPAATAPEPSAQVPAGTRVRSVPGPGETAQTYETSAPIEARPEWSEIRPRLTERHPIAADAATLLFEGLATALKAGDGLILVPDQGDPVFRRVASVTLQSAEQRTLVALQPKATARPAASVTIGQAVAQQVRTAIGPALSHGLLNKTLDTAMLTVRARIERFDVHRVHVSLAALRPPPPSVLALRTRAAVFGHNAPLWRNLPRQQRVGEVVEVEEKNADNVSVITKEHVPGIYADREPSWAESRLDAYPGHGGQPIVSLDAVHQGFVQDGLVALVDGAVSRVYRIAGVREVSKADFTLNAKVTELDLAPAAGLGEFGIRGTSVHGQSEALPLARLPIQAEVAGRTIDLEGFVAGLAKGRTIILCGELADTPGVRSCEAAVIELAEDVLAVGGHTRITLAEALSGRYVRATVTINANVAPATHGETVREILGSGDARLAFQRFALRQSPLTHVAAAGAGGTRTTLGIRVNDLLWQEVPYFHGHGPEERIYVTRLGDDGTTSVTFGDGRTGARLPTGQDNVRASYRKGIGLGGLTRAGQLSQLMDRPLGVKGVTNPLSPTGADDPESRDDARENAPLQVLTLGRIVSRRDFEDFARAFAGISKALATPVWTGERRGMLVTVAGPKGSVVEEGSELQRNLLDAMRAAGDPLVPVTVQSFLPQFFRVSAALVVEPDREAEKVVAEARARLAERFSFAMRGFGQAVERSEVVELLQSVPGVRAAHLTALHTGEEERLEPRLAAALPRWGSTAVSQAELLMLDPRPAALQVVP